LECCHSFGEISACKERFLTVSLGLQDFSEQRERCGIKHPFGGG
jgi:hypothetical protein